MMKVIHDPLHGSVKVEGLFLEMLDRHEMQRLRNVKQLGMGYMVFPGANHTRFEHSLGVYHLSGRMSDAIGLSKEDRDTVMVAGMLHDICHPSFSHDMEEIMEIRTGLDHMDLARKLIKGQIRTYREADEDLFGDQPPISELLENAGISSDKVCDLIAYPISHSKDTFTLEQEDKQSFFPSGDYVHQIIHGPVDADQMDYLMRDAHYTGVSLGTIDVDRILSTMRVYHDRIVIERGGAPAAEGLMVSRSLMYTSVYYHQTIRIAKMMLTKAAEASSSDFSDLYLWKDSDLVQELYDSGGVASRIMRSLENRRLYKKCFLMYSEKTSEEAISFLVQHSSYSKRKQLEQEIADKAGIDSSEVIVDMPSRSTLLSKIKIGKTDVSILDPDGNVRSLAKTSPIAKALQVRDPFGWSVMVAAPERHHDVVEKAAAKVFSL